MGSEAILPCPSVQHLKHKASIKDEANPELQYNSLASEHPAKIHDGDMNSDTVSVPSKLNQVNTNNNHRDILNSDTSHLISKHEFSNTNKPSSSETKQKRFSDEDGNDSTSNILLDVHSNRALIVDELPSGSHDRGTGSSYHQKFNRPYVSPRHNDGRSNMKASEQHRVTIWTPVGQDVTSNPSLSERLRTTIGPNAKSLHSRMRRVSDSVV